MEFRMSLLALAILLTLIIVIERRVVVLERGIDAAIARAVECGE